MISFDTQRFVLDHLDADVVQLLLRAHQYPNVDVRTAAAQIQARQKVKHKLPSWASHPEVVLPPTLNLEQGSSEATAAFKASLVAGYTLIDLTGGMGVDFEAMSRRFEQALYVEQNQALAALTAHNLDVLGVTNATYHTGDSLAWLREYPGTADWIYLDPARRSKTHQKVFFLLDCEPNVLEIRELLLEKSHGVLLKASPMLDVDLAVTQLQHVREVYAVVVENELKELLFSLGQELLADPILHAVSIQKDGTWTTSSFRRSDEQNAPNRLSPPLKYLYEANVGLLKLGNFRYLADWLQIYKLHPNSHLYTSETYCARFPGRSFEVLDVQPLDKKALRPWLAEGKANVTVRNFPLSVQQIRQKLSLAEGGELYFFATTEVSGKRIVIVAKRI